MNCRVKFIFISLILVFVVGCDAIPAERNNAGNEFFSQSQYQSALVTYQIAQVISPDSPEAYYNAGSAYGMIGEYEKAIAAFKQALKTADFELQVRVYYNLGNTYFMVQQFDDAIDAYQQALILKPYDEDARHNLELAIESSRAASPTPIQPTPLANNQSTPTPESPSRSTESPTNLSGKSPTPNSPENDVSTQATENFQTQSKMSKEDAVGILDAAQQSQQYLPESKMDDPETSDDDW